MSKDEGRALWLEARQKGIGGTDAAAILGLSKWQTPLGVWLEKQGQAPPREESEWLYWGQRLEPLIAARFEAKTGHALWKPASKIHHPEYHELFASVDYQLSNRKAGMDCKTSRTGEDWGREGTDEVPSAYIVQCQHYMAVTGFDLWYVAVLIGGSDFRVYEIRSDHELQEWMRERLLEWWNEHIVYGRRPPMDSSEGTRRWLRHRFPHDSGLMIPADAAANMAAVDLWRARAEKKQLEDDERKLEHYLYEQIGDASGIEGAGWRATWKRARDTKKTDWEAVARSLMTEVELFVASLSINGEKCVSDERIIQLREEMRQAHEQLIERNTSMREGSRRFLFRWAEEESE